MRICFHQEIATWDLLLAKIQFHIRNTIWDQILKFNEIVFALMLLCLPKIYLPRGMSHVIKYLVFENFLWYKFLWNFETMWISCDILRFYSLLFNGYGLPRWQNLVKWHSSFRWHGPNIAVSVIFCHLIAVNTILYCKNASLFQMLVKQYNLSHL